MDRRQSSPTDTPSVTEYLEQDHHRIDHLLAEVRQMLADGELERADSTFDEVERALRRHIRIEEEVLFPIFEARMAMGSRPVAVMSHEHRMLDHVLAGIRQALDGGDRARARSLEETLRGLIAAHNAKEERFLYPAIEGVLADGEREKLGERIRGM